MLILAALLVLQPAAANVVWAREVRLEVGDEDGSRMKAVAAAAEAAGAQDVYKRQNFPPRTLSIRPVMFLKLPSILP